MWTLLWPLLKALWSKNTIKYIDYLLLVAAIGGGLWYGYNWFYDRAYNAGAAAVEAKYKPIIDKFNEEATARNDKVALLEALSKSQGALIASMPTQLANAKNKALSDYVAKHPESKTKCGITEDGAAAYNTFLTTGQKVTP